MVSPLFGGRAARIAIAFGVLAPVGVLAQGCTDEIPDTTPLVTGARLLAAQAFPAEARPGTPLTFRALDVGPSGPEARALDWALCGKRPPLTSPAALSPDCLGPDGPALTPIGTGDAVVTAMPADVCQTFGPDQSAPKPGQPPARPADPDTTGGYYQPVRILVPDAPDRRATASFEARALCHLGGATPEQQRELDRRYRPNQNPTVLGLARQGTDGTDGTPIPSFETEAAAATAMRPGETVTLRVTWPACPGAGEDSCGDGTCGLDETPDGCPADCAPVAGCGGAEAYLWFDPAARAFAVRRESIVVSWFATAGRFATARTGRSEAEAPASSDSDNRWTAPLEPGEVWLWVVLRDDRGGVAWSTHHLRVE